MERVDRAAKRASPVPAARRRRAISTSHRSPGSSQGPKDWYRVDGNQSLLWYGWDKGADHRWFRFAPGEIDPRRLHRPTIEYISQAIDFPLVETKGGTIWQRIPSESPVVGYKIENLVCVYPVAILGKVLVINDIVDKHPYMIVVNPFARPKQWPFPFTTPCSKGTG